MSFPTEREIVGRALGRRRSTHERRPSRTTEATAVPRRRPLVRAPRRSLGARLIDFAGWEMPVRYAGIIDEHAPSASGPGCSTCRTWARCGSAAPARRRRSPARS